MLRIPYGVAIVLAVLVAASRAADELPVPLQDDRDKASYGLGMSFAREFQRTGLDINLEALLAGLEDGMADKEPRVSEEEFAEAMQRVQQKAQQAMLARMKVEGEKNLKVAREFLAKNGERKEVVKLSNGLQYQVLKAGKGATPKRTDTVRTHYRGTFLNGNEFDSSYERGEPAVFGVEDVIDGWTQALLRMKVGDKWQLWVPPDLGYGEFGRPPEIGPNSLLIFEIELLDID